jgi:trimeric autotransporter adhesin
MNARVVIGNGIVTDAPALAANRLRLWVRRNRLSWIALLLALTALTLPHRALAQGYCPDGGLCLGVNSIALGVNTSATQPSDVAIGNGASTTGTGDAISLGAQATSSGNEAIALGPVATATGNAAVALGANASATASDGLAVGTSANATGTSSTALGASATASTPNSLAVGTGAAVNGGNSIGIGVGTSAAGNNSVVIGTQDHVTAPDATVVGNANGTIGIGTGSTTVGFQAQAGGNSALAAGLNANAAGGAAVALGNAANAFNSNDVAIGAGATAGVNAGPVNGDVAIGAGASATGGNSLAIGPNTSTGAGATVALGNGATIAAGAGLGATAIGNGATVLSGTGTVSIGNQTTGSGTGAVAIGSPDIASGLGAVAVGANNAANGQGSVALGNANTATGQGSVALGNGSGAAAPGSLALGNVAAAAGTNGVALGSNAVATNPNDVALGAGSITATPHSGMFDVTGGTPAGTGANAVVSVGTAVAPRQIQNVGAGVLSPNSLDAVNGSQLYSVASGLNGLGASAALALGGGATYTPGTGMSTPSYSVDGKTYTSVGAAISALNGDLLASPPAGGASGPVQYSAPLTPTTPDAGTATQDVTLVGANASAPVAVNNVAAGTLSATSSQAVNGAQLFATNAQLGKNTAAVSGATNALGGGASYNATTGTFTAPTYSVGGTTYNNVGGAISALASGAGSPIRYSDAATPGTPNGGTVTNSVTLVGSSGPVVLGNVAAGTQANDAVTVAQLDAASMGKNPNAVTYSNSVPNTLTLTSPYNGGNPNEGVTVNNVAPGNVSPNSTQAVNGAQLYASEQAMYALAQRAQQDYASLASSIGTVQQEAYAGTAAAIAAAGLRYDDRPGKVSTAAALGYYHDQTALAAGIGANSQDGSVRFNAGFSYSPGFYGIRSDVGAVMGASKTWN